MGSDALTPGTGRATLSRPREFPLEVAEGFSNKSDAQHSGRLPELPMTSLHALSGVVTGGLNPPHPTKLALKIALVRPRRSE